VRVLWVEDFGGSSDAESICNTVFSGLLPKGLESLAETQRRGAKRPDGYEAWRCWHERQRVPDEPEIDIYRRSRDIDALLKSGYLVDRYDAILLDINLENNFFESDETPNPTEGGFWLYNKLVRAGFPSGRIALLTAHSAEQPTEEFQAGCARYGHEQLYAFGKTNSEAGKWLTALANANEGFIRLRRGALDGIVFVEQLLSQHGAQAIRFNLYVGSNEDWTFDQALDYLDTIRHLLPVRVTGAQIALQLRGFRYLLACEWERAQPRGDDPIYKSLGWVMKSLRNWSSHGHLLDNASVSDIAFLTLACLRVGFLDPVSPEDELRPYEHDLLAVIGDEKDFAVLPNRLARFYVSARQFLKTQIGNSSRLLNENGGLLQDREPFHLVVKELSVADTLPTKFDFPAALRELFVHAVLSPKYRAIGNDDAENMQAIESAYAYAWQKQRDTLPSWVTATWMRL
jgi:hypothetical protein